MAIKLTIFLTLSGSKSVKAAHKTLVKLTSDVFCLTFSVLNPPKYLFSYLFVEWRKKIGVLCGWISGILLLLPCRKHNLHKLVPSLSRRKKRKKTFLFASFHEPILYKKLSFLKEIVINYLKVLSYKRIMYILARNLEHHRSSLSDTNCSIRLPPTVNKT